MGKKGTRRTIRPTQPRELATTAPVTDDHIDKLVAQIRHVTRLASLQVAIEVGALVVEKIFGDVEQYRSRGEKDISYRRLAEHPELPFSAATLYRFVAVYELVQRFPGLAKSSYFELAHLRAVLGLPAATQERLLRIAEHERLTGEQLHGRADAERERDPSRRGRPPVPVALKSLRRFEQLLDDGGLPMDTSAFDRLVVDDAKRAAGTVLRVREWCDAVHESLARRIGTIDVDDD